MDHLGKEFEIRSMPANRFLGLDITRDRLNRKICLSQTDYIRNMLEKFNMTDCSPLGVPADPSCKFSPMMCPQNEEEETSMSNIPYRELIGSLTHVSHTTRSDIAQALGQVSQYAQKPRKEHWKAAKRILAYLKKSQNVGIQFGGGSNLLIGAKW